MSRMATRLNGVAALAMKCEPCVAGVLFVILLLMNLLPSTVSWRARTSRQIEHYRLLVSRITDQPTVDGIKQLIERMQVEKLSLHPEQTK
jgi:hypothetical protein